MKYIRTKDGIFRIKATPQSNVIYSGSQTYRIYDHIEMVDRDIIEKDIIKQADTIEELCDEFIDTSELKTTNTGGWLFDEFDNKNKCLVYYAEDERRTIPLNEFDDLSKIYGAIWTDKGLIYVAKMNDKGGFKLL